MRGNITRRGRNSWRLKFDLPDAGGQRQTRYATTRGTRRDAERELNRLVGAAHGGTFVEASKVTVAEYLRAWLDGAHGLSAKTAEEVWRTGRATNYPALGQHPNSETAAGADHRLALKALDGRRQRRSRIIGDHCWTCSSRVA